MTIRYLSLWKGVVIPIQPTRRQIMDEIVAYCAEAHGVPLQLMRRPAQHDHRLSRARQEAMYHIYAYEWSTLPMIARYMGLTHHTSVLHGVRQHKRRLDQQKALAA